MVVDVVTVVAVVDYQCLTPDSSGLLSRFE